VSCYKVSRYDTDARSIFPEAKASIDFLQAAAGFRYRNLLFLAGMQEEQVRFIQGFEKATGERLALTTTAPDVADRWGRIDQLKAEYAQCAGAYSNNDRRIVDQWRSTTQSLVSAIEALRSQGDLTQQHLKRIAGIYATARGDLITNIGQYCSYCEMPLAASLAIEHKLPKNWFPRFSISWENFLLACPICNSIKHDRPTLAEAAATLKLTDPDSPGLPDAAQRLFVWPDDPGYERFNREFCYIVVLRRYTVSGEVFSETPMRPALMRSYIIGRRMSLADDDEQGHPRVKISPQIFSLDYFHAEEVTRYLKQVVSLTGLDPKRGTEVPSILRVAFSRITHATPDLIAPPRYYECDLKATGATLEPRGDNEWLLTHKVEYRLTRKDKVKVKSLDEIDPRPLFESKSRKEYREALAALNAGVLPWAIADSLGAHPLVHAMEIVEDELTGIETLVLTRKYRLAVRAETVVCYAEHVLPLELHLMGLTDPARNTIKLFKLNENDAQDPKNADRRVSHRIKAYFAAIQSLYHLSDAGDLPEAFRQTLVNLINEHAISTGFITVWMHVMRHYLTASHPDKADVIRALATAIAGTRS
jgi:5-methylcytosine-specific restriction endonuclease McrA